MKVFFDCEFTDLTAHASLISVGFVTLNDRSLYIELTDGWQVEECSDFVIENVLPLLGNGEQLSRRQAASRIYEWLAATSEAGGIELLCDSTWDPVMLRPLLPAKISGLTPKIEVIAFAGESEQTAFLDSLEILLGSGLHGPQHHALADACALREVWITVSDKRGN